MKLEYLITSKNNGYISKRSIANYLQSKPSFIRFKNNVMTISADGFEKKYSIKIFGDKGKYIVEYEVDNLTFENISKQMELNSNIRGFLKQKFSVILLTDPFSSFFRDECRPYTDEYELGLRKLLYLLIRVEESNQAQSLVKKKYQEKLNEYTENITLEQLNKLLFARQWYFEKNQNSFVQVPVHDISTMSNWLLGLSELPEFYSTWEIYTSANEENNLQELINIEKVEDIRNKVAHNRIMEQEDYDFTVQKLSKVNSEIKTICRDIIFGLVKVEIDLTPLSKILDQQMQNITSVIQEMSNVGNSVQQVINNLTVPTKILGNSFTAIECSLQFTKPIHDFLNSNPFNNQIQMATDIMQKMNQVTRPFEDIQKIAREAAKKTYINPPILLDSVIDPDLPDSERIMRYIELLEMSYDDAVFMLKDSHGKVQGDYFLKESYDKFFSGKIKVLRKNNKISRLEDGLLTHHVLFDKYKKINESTSILSQSIPFEVQESKNLVYVDIWEKFILHVLKSRDKSRLDSEAKRRITQQDFSIRQPTLDMGLPTSYQCLVFKTTMIF